MKNINQLYDERRRVRIYTTNGYQMVGYITGIEDDCIVFEMNGVEQIVYKHAISTIRPE